MGVGWGRGRIGLGRMGRSSRDATPEGRGHKEDTNSPSSLAWGVGKTSSSKADPLSQVTWGLVLIWVRKEPPSVFGLTPFKTSWSNLHNIQFTILAIVNWAVQWH